MVELQGWSHRMLRGLLGCVLLLSTVSALPPPASAEPCPNEELRVGFSANLPDCRAYELVSPSDSDGRLLEALQGWGFSSPVDFFSTELLSPAGDSAVYMTYGTPLREPGEATGYLDVYESRRDSAGWHTIRRVTPSGPEATGPIPGGVSVDHKYAFVDISLFDGAVPPLPSGSLAQAKPASYLSNPDGTFEFTAKGSLVSEPYGQGRYISEGGEHIIFSTGKHEGQSLWCLGAGADCKAKQLELDGPPEGTGGVYDREAGGGTRVISLLPGNEPQTPGQEAYYQGSSKDGTAVAFKVEGVLYLRINNAVTEEVAAGNPTYAGLSEEGEFIYYVSGGNIHRFDTATKNDSQVNASGDGEVVNVSGDGSHVYFISKSQLDGANGTAGEPNLYVWSGAAPEYIGTVALSDLQRTSGNAIWFGLPALTRWTSHVVAPSLSKEPPVGPGADSSRSTPDGSVLIFESRAKLTGYENAGHTEIYRYEDGAGSLTCVSCGPGVPASSDAQLQNLNLVDVPIAVHNLSDDGNRVFFETAEALAEDDTDEVNDIYEWRAGEGGGPATLDLISSGKSTGYTPLKEFAFLPTPNVLLSVTPSGEDVLFLSQDSLVPGAGLGGVPAIYDAKVGGGFATPVESEVCAEEGCRLGNPAAPQLSSPLSESTIGSGNVKPRKAKRRCHRVKGRDRHKRCGRRKRGDRARSSVSRKGEGESTDLETLSGAAGPVASPSATPSKSLATASETSSEEFNDEFGIAAVEAGLSTSNAGMHPDFTTRFVLNHRSTGDGMPIVGARLEDAKVSIPPGLLANPNAFPRCSTGQLIAHGNCPIDAQVGIAKVWVTSLKGPIPEPIYVMDLPHPEREVARFGFIGYQYPVFINVKVRTAGDYGVTAVVEDSPALSPLVEAETIFWGNPPDESHDELRLTAKEAGCPSGTACEAPGGKRDSTLPPTAFMSNPSACQKGEVGFAVTSYQLPGKVFTKSAALPPITNCSNLPFSPGFEAKPISSVAGAATGLDASFKLPQSSDPNIPSTATMREARVTLPEGMGINPAAASAIDACSAEQVHFHEEVDVGCPDASKLGTVDIISPNLPRPIHGALYQRSPEPGHQFQLWLASDDLGLHVKLPGEIQPDPATGRLTVVFSDLPQVPVEEIDFHIWGGARAPLKNPDSCGTFTTSYTFTPHSTDPPVSGQSQVVIDGGCAPGFAPKLRAGVTKPVAGAFSPFILDLTREDGEQQIQSFDVVLPKGELAKLAGVPLCSDDPASTAASSIGTVTVAAGAGPEPLWLPEPGKAPTAIYLAGPYQGAPFSLVTTVPAQAGPFDLGDVVVRSALMVDPESAQATVKTNLPQFVEGVPAAYRRLHAVIDRPEFSLNPTNCRELEVDAKVTSTTGAIAQPADRFQVDGCKALGFKPKLAFALGGGTKRGDFPTLTARLKARRGDANIGRVSVALPHSEFLAQSHIGTICTRVQFAADKCPKRSIYGRAAAWTPLLDKPLRGPVYLRANGGDRELPDLVAALGGEIDINLVGFIDSSRGGIRTTFAAVPDAPVSRFVLKMKGGAKGLLENSTDICARRHRVGVAMAAQNGRASNLRPTLEARCPHDREERAK